MPARHPRNRILELIALFKFVKVLLLLVLVGGALEFVRPSVTEQAREWLGAISFAGEPRFVRELLAWVSGLSTTRIRELGVVALAYATLYAVEGVGLWRERRWAEYLTLLATTSFIPFELLAMTRGVSPSKLFTVAVNVAVCAYLVWLLRRTAGAKPEA